MGTIEWEDRNQQSDHRDVEAFIRLDIVGLAAAALIVLIVNVTIVKNNGVWLVYPPMCVLAGCLAGARHALQGHKLSRSLTLIAIGNWIISLAVAVVLPFLWPVMVLTTVMPLVLASPHLGKVPVIRAVIATATVAAIVAALGLINDDGGVIDDIDDTLELVVVVASLAAVIAPVGMIAWLHNQRQRDHVQRLEALNQELRTSQGELAASRSRVVQAADAERRRIERDLHDGAQQHLVALGVRLRLLESQTSTSEEPDMQVTTVITELDSAIQNIRDLAHGIYPPLLEAQGLSAALRAVVRRSTVKLSSAIDEVERLGQATESALYFVALESLTNIAKHAPDAEVSVRLEQIDNGVLLTIIDDGPGFDLADSAWSHGLHNMYDRIAVVGGTLTIVSTPGDGTSVTAQVPNQVELGVLVNAG